MGDVNLIKGIIKKDSFSLEILMDKYLNYVSVIVHNIVGGFLKTEDIEEICMDVFIKLWNNAEKIDTTYKTIKPYLASIARNTARNKLKSVKNLEIPLDDEMIIIDNKNICEEVLHNELAELLNKYMLKLPETDREIMVRYYFYYQKVKDIAGELNINENTVKTKLSRGRSKLKIMFEERGFMNED